MTAYATVLQVCDFLQWTKEAPEFVSGSSPTLEEVDTSGTLANGSVIYLDHNRVIDGSQVISYGASASSVTALTETTHYTLDDDSGKITITTAGAAAITTNKVYASYKYIEIDGKPSLKGSFISDQITRAQALMDGYMNRTFSAVTQYVREEHIGKGYFQSKYRPKNLGLHIKRDVLTNDESAASTTFEIASTTGITAGDYMTVGTEIVKVGSVDTGLQLTVARAQLGTTAVAHVAGEAIVNCAMEISNTPRGSTPSFTMVEHNKSFEVSDNSHCFTLQQAITVPADVTNTYAPELGTANRVRLTYSAGASSVPSPITQACILQVATWLAYSAVAKSLVLGVDGFNPQTLGSLSAEVKNLLNEYRLMLIDGF